MIDLNESMGPGSNSGPLDLQSDLHLLPDTLPTVLCGPGFMSQKILQELLSWDLTLKAPITTAAEGKFCDTFPNFRQK